MPLRESPYVKIVVIVPHDQAEQIRQALHDAGAGQQGNYDHASSSMPVTGRFRPRAGAQPAIGAVGTIEQVPEERVEVLCHRDLVAAAVAAVRQVHPYEEPPIDIIPRLEVQ